MRICTDKFECQSSGTTFKELSLTAFGKFLVPVPPISEQHEICYKLDYMCQKMNLLVENLDSQIKTLQNLKTRLISDVVTGKIDVRGVEVPEFAPVEEEAGTDIVEEEVSE